MPSRYLWTIRKWLIYRSPHVLLFVLQLVVGEFAPELIEGGLTRGVLAYTAVPVRAIGTLFGAPARLN
jgi:hypothetical protein